MYNAVVHDLLFFIEVLSISIMYTSDDGEQSLNFISEDKKEYDTWLIGLRVSRILE